MIQCPFCTHQAVDHRGLASHFRHQAETHPNYKQWKADQRWAGKVEGEDYVVCLECGHRAASLARHLKAEHGITADEYRVRHGDVLIRPSKVTAKRSKAIKERCGGFGRGETKSVTCLVCGDTWTASKFLGTHDSRCTKCKEATRWMGKSEPEDYITCRECGYRAGNLTSHLQHAHPGYREKYPDAMVVCLNSPVRDKSALKGRRRC
jgi:predicted transcriptional regulator